MYRPDHQERLNSSSLEYVEEIYLRYLEEPSAVAEEWRDYFARHPLNGDAHTLALGPSFKPRSLFNPPSGASSALLEEVGAEAALLQQKVDRIIRNYRVRGHRLANLSPLGRESFEAPELQPSYYGLTDADMARPVPHNAFAGASTVAEVIQEHINESVRPSTGTRRTYQTMWGAFCKPNR